MIGTKICSFCYQKLLLPSLVPSYCLVHTFFHTCTGVCLWNEFPKNKIGWVKGHIWILLVVSSLPSIEILSTLTSKEWANERLFLFPCQYYIVEFLFVNIVTEKWNLFMILICISFVWSWASLWTICISFWNPRLALFSSFPEVLLPGW